ncbi:MAG: histidine kinase dimerization/phosphoacceptor domain -containing protein [Methanomicrobiales archaeon]
MADKIRVLYVDDEPALLDLCKIFLEDSGEFSVETIESASAALVLLKKEPFDAIVSDYLMPGMDGIRFLAEVRTHVGKIPFILFTGKGREEIVIEAIAHGVDFYLQKGGNPKAQFAELVQKIRAAVERRTSENAFKESENRYRSLVDTMQFGIVVIDAQTHTILQANPKALEMIGGTGESVLGLVCHHFICPAESGKCPITDLGQMIDTSERILLTRRGEKIPILKSVIRTMLGGKEVLIESFIDITDRKKAEEAQISSLHEKELLLKEIHHRVKNNLQTIASLLYLQSLSTDDEAIKKMLNEARSRVSAMGSIHQKLYQSADLTRIPFTDYISQLIEYLKESDGVDETKIRISVSVKPEDLFFDLDTGIPCGLIINELVMNALKYAFRNRPGGTITIRMARDETDQNVLLVSDDGHGISEDFELTTMKSLGMTIVASLVRQLGGTMEMVRQPGTTITIRFPTQAPLPSQQPASAEKPGADDEPGIDEKIKRIRAHHG